MRRRRSFMLRQTAPVLVQNTFIGGVGASTITSATDLANLTSLSVSNISNFTILNNNVSCSIDTNYTINDLAFNSNSEITYYIDVDSFMTGFTGNSAFASSTLKYAYLGNLDGGSSPSFSRHFFNSSTIKTVISPNTITIGTNDGSNQNFTLTDGVSIVVNTGAQTSNGGGVEGDLTDAINNYGATVYYSSNTTAPNPVTTLAVTGTVYAQQLSYTLTPPTSTNTILGYEVWLNNGFLKFVNSNNFDIGNLVKDTEYTVFVYAIDEHGNRSTKSNTVVQSTSATYVIPTGNIISSYEFENNVLDSVGSNNGTATALTYTSGLVTQTGVFNGSNSLVDCGNDASLQITTGSVVCILNATSAGSSFRGIVVKSLAYGLFLNNGNLIAYDWSAVAIRNTGVNLNDGLDHIIVFNFDSGVTNGSTIYLDNELVLTFTYTISSQSNNMAIGADPSNVQNINGKIDEVNIFDRVLTEIEISEINANLLEGLHLT